MSSKNKEDRSSSNKKKISFFNSSRKSKSPVAASPSTDNSIKIEAIAGIEAVAETAAAAAAVAPASKKTRKAKVLATVAAPTPNAGPSEPKKVQGKKLTKLFKKSKGTKKEKNAPPLSAEADPGLGSSAAAAQNEALAVKAESNVVAAAAADAEPAAVVVDPGQDQAATKIQAAFRSHKERRRVFLQTKQKVIKVEALARGFLARKLVEQLKKSNQPTAPDAENTEQEQLPES